MRFFWLLIAFTAGSVGGWLATGKLTADWVGAVGTWVGAVATIATIIWAVRSFQIEKQDRVDARSDAEADQLRAEQTQAMEFIVRVRGGGGYGPDDDKTMTNVNVEILNGSKHSATLESIELPGVTLKDPVGALGLPLIVPPQQEQVWPTDKWKSNRSRGCPIFNSPVDPSRSRSPWSATASMVQGGSGSAMIRQYGSVTSSGCLSGAPATR